MAKKQTAPWRELIILRRGFHDGTNNNEAIST
jgi:hypothetical protein